MAVVLAPTTARSDPLDLRPVEVRDTRIEPGSAQAEDTAFRLTLDAQRAALEGGDLAEHLGRTIGVQVRRMGALGDPASLLIRGSSASQVLVLLDGIPLALGRGGLVDLSLFPLLALGSVEVFRGYVPAEFGAEGLGGAVNLVPGRAGREAVTRILTGVGSHGFVQLGAARSARSRSWQYAVNGAIQGARNDYRFFSDNDTPYETGDDAWLTRENSQAFIGSILGWAEWRPRPGLRVSFLESLQWKDRGVPGGGAIQALETRQRSLHQVFDVKVDKARLGHPTLSGMLRASVQTALERFSDPLGEFPGGAREQEDLSWSIGLVGRLSFAPHAPQILSLIPEWRFEDYRGRAAGRSLPQAQRSRLGVAVRDRVALGGDRLSLTPVLRADLLWNEVSGQSSGGEPLEDSFHWFLSPRLGARLGVVRGLEFLGNIGRYFRPPSLYELYGDRGTTIGNPLLSPETGMSGDLGLGLKWPKPLGGLTQLRVEAAFFGREARDLIQWIRSSPHTMTAINVARATALGAEVSAGAWIRWHRHLRTRASLSYAFTHTENRSVGPLLEGKRLPGRPLHEVNGRLDLAWTMGSWGAGIHWAVAHVSDSYLDEANLFLPVPSRTLHEVGLALRPWVSGVVLALTVKNVGDLRLEHQAAPAFTGLGRIPRPLMDFAGFPLPGWQIFVTLSITGRDRGEGGREDPT
jgi:iron complex outermembrane receptor protein